MQVIPYSCRAPSLNKSVWLLIFWDFRWPLGLGRGRGYRSFHRWQKWAQMGNCLLALLFKTSALFTAPAALCGGAHSSIHSSTLYPPVPPTICISYQFLLILQSFKEERKKVLGEETHPCAWAQFCGRVLPCRECHQLGAPKPRICCGSLLPPPSLCWLLFCQQCALTVKCSPLGEQSFTRLPFF